MSQADCGLSAHDVALLNREVTHIVHCAASVEFNLPIADAAAANITSALHVLELARGCKKLKQMVSVSAAYTTPHVSDTRPVHETLAALPFDAETVYRSILDGTADEKALLAQTGHPNTYTFTKCITEHLLYAKKGSIPLVIVRPSVVSAAWRHPFPAWIDSAAAFAGFVVLIGMGHLHVVAANPSTRLDVVPCDIVADRILAAAFGEPVQWGLKFAVAGLQHSCRVDTMVNLITGFFRSYPVDRPAYINHILSPSTAFRVHEMRLQRIPTRLARTWFDFAGNKKMGRQAKKLAEKLKYLNRAFPYFTSNTFDFRASEPLSDKLFRREQYIELACMGVFRHLLKRDDTQMLLGGRKLKDAGPLGTTITDLQWVASQPNGNWAIRTFAFAVRQALRQSTSQVTFDRASFAQAVAATPPGTLHVLIPTHRSYMDFLLCSYLFFARPDLGIQIPHIAAAEEFSRIPILGELFKKTQAFYLRRGLGKPDEALTKHVHQLVEQGETIQFFIEGARSRSRQYLTPRHGLLRCLQATGKTFTLLPISITYDRVPEEVSLERELRGHARPEMQLRALLAWTAKLARGEVDLGRVHLHCGEPVVMGPKADVRALGREVMARLQSGTATSTHHLRCFLEQNRDLEGLDQDWLRDAIENRGGLVIDSPLEVHGDVDAVTELCMRYHWMHLFYPEAQALWPDHPAIAHHARQNGFHVHERDPEADLRDPRVRSLLRAVFEPVARDYAQVADRLGSTAFAPRHASARSLLHEAPESHLPYLQSALEDLAERGIVVLDGKLGAVAWGPNADGLPAYKQACVWPPAREEDVEARHPSARLKSVDTPSSVRRAVGA